MHNGLLKMGTAKMAGSVGNVVNIADLLQKHHPETVRFLLLEHALPQPDRIQRRPARRDGEGAAELLPLLRALRAHHRHDVILSIRRRTQRQASAGFSEFRQRFLEAMDDDFNTGGAVGVLFELLTALNRFADTKKLEEPTADAAAKADSNSAWRSYANYRHSSACSQHQSHKPRATTHSEANSPR